MRQARSLISKNLVCVLLNVRADLFIVYLCIQEDLLRMLKLCKTVSTFTDITASPQVLIICFLTHLEGRRPSPGPKISQSIKLCIETQNQKQYTWSFKSQVRMPNYYYHHYLSYYLLYT